jgi:hypothetical protein
MQNTSFIVYVDESGDEGFSFGHGSSEWFILSAVITRKPDDLNTVKLVDNIRSYLGRPPKKTLHFRDIRHEQRLPYINQVSKAKLKAVSVFVYKPSITEPENFNTRYRLYFYSVRYLLERVSWFCRDHRLSKDQGDGSAEVVFSNRSGMSYDEMKNYLDLLKLQSDLRDIRIDWNVIKTDQIVAWSSGRRMGLQIADAIASSSYYAVQDSTHGFTEDRYIRMLKPVIYKHKGQYLGYGLKFWPRETDEMLRKWEGLEWVRKDFQ